MKSLLLAALLTLTTVPQAFSEAYYQDETEMVAKATVIAIIEISPPAVCEQKSASWTYLQSANATVIKRIKGELPDTLTLHGSETFLCAQCRLSAGRYLAFLRRDGNLWVGSNWQLSLRPLKAETVEWYASPEQQEALTFQPLDGVLQRIRDILAAGLKSTVPATK